MAFNLYGIRFKPSLNAENLSYIVSRTLACACIHMYEYACMKHAYAKLEHACAYMCMRTHVLGFPWSHFFKNSLFNQKISYIFHKYFLQVNFHLIGTLGFRVLTSLGNEGPSHKGYKMRCLHLDTIQLQVKCILS